MKRVIIALAIVVIAQTTDSQGRQRSVHAGANFLSPTLDLAQLPPEQVRRYHDYEALPSTLRLRMAEIMVEPSHAPVLNLNLFGDHSYIATMTKLQENDGGYTWEGVLGGDGGTAILVVRGSQVTGWIWATRIGSRDEFFSISAIGGHTHVIRQTNQDWFNSIAGCTTAETTSIPKPLLADDQDEKAEAKPDDRFVPNDLSMRKVATPNGTSCHCITNVLVAYTPATQKYGDMTTLAQLAVTQTNNSYMTNKKTDGPELNLVGTMLVNYTESRELTGGISKDLIRLKEPSDHWMDEVHSMRDSLGADFVVLFVDDLHLLGFHGQAWQVATHDTAFAVVDWQSATDNLTFAHEIGHLQGADHDTSTTSPQQYAHGACRTAPYHYKTIMAICTEDRVPYWSNPDVKYKNVETGDTNYRNNARVLRESSCSTGRRVQKTLAMLSYQGPDSSVPRIITAFEGGGIYSSPDGLRLGGGCNTIEVYPGPQKVTAMLSYTENVWDTTTRLITAFEGGGIYSSPGGLDLGGGGCTNAGDCTTAVYPGPQKVRAMITYKANVWEPTRVITAFEGGGIYSSPNGRDLGGGGGTMAVYPGPQRVTAMLVYPGPDLLSPSNVITAFEGGGIYSSPDGLNLGGGGKTISVYSGPQRVTAMLYYQPDKSVQGRVITAFEGGGIYSSPDGLNLGGGGKTTAVYPGPQRVTAMISYQGPDFSKPPRLITAFESGAIYSSPGGLDLGGGGCANAEGCTTAVYPGPYGVREMISYQGRVITAFDGAGIYSSPDGMNLGGGGDTISVYP